MVNASSNITENSFTPAQIIQKKRDGETLTQNEIQFFIDGLMSGTFANYQASSLLMATYFQGMNTAETVDLTKAMAYSGKMFNWAETKRPLVDKHSTGGVGDKVSLILAPLASACGLAVPMMSGRGLGHTGGTTDKLESIPGFTTSLSDTAAMSQLADLGVIMLSQNEKIAPADKILYSLRDVTGTIESIPLITASILSKKLAEGTKGLLLDVKVGNGAFMSTQTQARKLAQSIVQTAHKLGIQCRALLTDMNQPLGCSAGHLLEVKECIDILSMQETQLCSADLIEITLQSCAHMLQLGGLAKGLKEGRKIAQQHLRDGSAWKVFQKLVAAQGGDLSFIRSPEKWPKAPVQTVLTAKRSGFISKMHTRDIGNLLVQLGGGRKQIGDPIDPTVGFLFHSKLGCAVKKGDPLVEIHCKTIQDSEHCKRQLEIAIEVTGSRKPRPKLILTTITND